MASLFFFGSELGYFTGDDLLRVCVTGAWLIELSWMVFFLSTDSMIILYMPGYLYLDFNVFLGESLLIQEAERQPPHKIDENMWKNREQIEEILFLLEDSNWPTAVR